MIISLRYLVIAVFVGMFLAGSASAQEQKMYSWTDEDGTVHFSETQPQGQDVQEQVIPQASQQASDNPYADVDSGPSYAQQKRDEIARKSDEAQVDKAIGGAQCAGWQAELERLEPNRRVFYTNEQGETERMDDVVRTDKVAQLKSQIAKNCK
jgi:hypothetical protein